ncbi:hypothetical protein [Grimontia hollisae]|uniref:Uncharacterized protein n=1 Tax=Grimontia hollisae TaxID=673 RepID=A0A377HNM2_GRIHO|nr:hypothetical protein [Grimontia hollisae]STO57603.1 Uncharacterised protein [Grimontia hollisae]
MAKITIKKTILALTKMGNIETELGTLCNFALSGKAAFDLDDYLSEAHGKSIYEIEPKLYVRALAKFTCYPLSSLSADGERPQNYPLGDEDLDKLSDSSLEKIAILQLKGGKNSQLSDVESSKNECVLSAIQTRHIKTKNDISKHHLEMTDYLKNLQSSVFSDELQTQLHTTSLLGDSLHQQINQIRSLNIAGTTSALDAYNNTIHAHQRDIELALGPELSHMRDYISPSSAAHEAMSSSIKPSDILSSYTFPEPEPFKAIDWAKSFRDKEEAKRVPFRELGTKLDKLVDVTAQSVQYMNQMNENMRLAAEETKRSSDAASRNVKWTLFFTIVSILISVVSLNPSWVGISSSPPKQLPDTVNLEQPAGGKPPTEKVTIYEPSKNGESTSSIDDHSLLEVQLAPHNSETLNSQL